MPKPHKAKEPDAIRTERLRNSGSSMTTKVVPSAKGYDRASSKDIEKKAKKGLHE
jgi:hypothetical protein